ncbi:MAG: ABC-ATPase UvrA, partial [Candidatus Aminicenantes bacterium]|nr:ABC-ATPase UvrA [Candidatus Aminicenantes bacterium]
MLILKTNRLITGYKIKPKRNGSYMQDIEIVGATKHNLKNINLKIPKKKIITITGVSGSGKSSLAYDTIFQEGQRKYLESLSIYARQFIKSMEKPDVGYIKGISPTISIDQKHSSYYFNSTVGTISDLSQYLRLLFAKVGEAQCPECGRRIETFSQKKILEFILDHFIGKELQVMAPVVKNRKGIYKVLFERFLKRGFLKTMLDGEIYELDSVPPLNRNVVHNIEIVIDVLEVGEKNLSQLSESISLAIAEGDGEIKLISDGKEYFLSDRLFCSYCNLSLKEPQPASFSFMSPLGYCINCRGIGILEGNNPCPDCRGSGLNKEALAFYFRGKNIFEYGEMEISDLLGFFTKVSLNEREQKILAQIYPHIIQRLEAFVRLNLDYLSLN